MVVTMRARMAQQAIRQKRFEIMFFQNIIIFPIYISYLILVGGQQVPMELQ